MSRQGNVTRDLVWCKRHRCVFSTIAGSRGCTGDAEGTTATACPVHPACRGRHVDYRRWHRRDRFDRTPRGRCWRREEREADVTSALLPVFPPASRTKCAPPPIDSAPSAMLSPAVLPRLSLAAALLLSILAMPTAYSTATEWNCGVRVQDEVYAVNTRASGCTTDPAHLAATLEVTQFAMIDAGTRSWIDRDFAALTESPGPGVLTVVYVHGNQISHCEALERSLAVYRALVRGSCSDQPVRFVVWSWPAGKIPGMLHDFRVKALRTRPVGWQLAWALDQFPTDSPLGLIGYSYGARIIGGATHVLAGGDLSGLALTERVHPDRPPVRVAFMAAATHNCWFGPGQYHGMAMQQIDRLWLTVNPNDPAMRFYSLSSANSSPEAMGEHGPTCLDYDARSRVTCVNVSKSVGRTHDLYVYVGSQHRMHSMWQHLSTGEVSSPPAAEVALLP